MTIDTTFLDADSDNIMLARPALLAAAQAVNALQTTGASALIPHTPASGPSTTVQDELRSVDSSIDYLNSPDKYNQVFGLHHAAAAVMILGDSIWGSGVGATTQAQGTPTMVARSLANDIERGEKLGVGHRYHMQLNSYPNGGAWVDQGVTTGGGVTPKANGLTNWCYTVPAGGYLEITGRQFNSADVWYDAAQSTTGTMTVALNGVTVTTKPITAGAGIVNTYTQAGVPAWLRPGEQNASCDYSDVVRLTFSQACVIKAVIAPRAFPSSATNVSPFIFTAGYEGGRLSYYQTAAIWDEIAAYLNFNDFTGTGGPKLMVIGFGINDIYLARYSPATMVAYLAALVAGINARCTNVKFAYVMPFDGDPSRMPGLGFTYPPAYPFADYVAALNTYCVSAGVTVLRADRIVTDPTILVDGVHPDTNTHRRLGYSMAKMLGAPFNPELTTIVLPAQYDATGVTVGDVAYNSTWRAYTNSTPLSLRAHKRGSRIDLSGLVEPNGSVSLTICTLPVGYRPVGRSIWLQAQTTVAGVTVMITITAAGVVSTSAIPASGVIVLEGLGFEVSSS